MPANLAGENGAEAIGQGFPKIVSRTNSAVAADGGGEPIFIIKTNGHIR